MYSDVDSFTVSEEFKELLIIDPEKDDDNFFKRHLITKEKCETSNKNDKENRSSDEAQEITENKEERKKNQIVNPYIIEVNKQNKDDIKSSKYKKNQFINMNKDTEGDQTQFFNKAKIEKNEKTQIAIENSKAADKKTQVINTVKVLQHAKTQVVQEKELSEEDIIKTEKKMINSANSEDQKIKLKLIEKEKLEAKLGKMEKYRKKLEKDLENKGECSRDPVRFIDNLNKQCESVQMKTKYLENRLFHLMKQNTDKMNELKDNIRKLVIEEADLQIKYMEIKSAFPEIEKNLQNSTKIIDLIKNEEIEIELTPATELNAELDPLLKKKCDLGEAILKLKQEQIVLKDTLNYKKRMRIIEIAEYDSEIKILRAKCRNLDDTKKQLFEQLENIKSIAKNTAQYELEKIRKLEAVVLELSERFKKLTEEKRELENINLDLQSRIAVKNSEISKRNSTNQ